MAVDDKPIAIRIARPQGSEDEFFAEERDTMSRSTVVLLGASTRPTGTLLRFEVALSTGKAVLRGEGRVVEYRENAFQTIAGLVVKFTKLDARTKALIDRAHEARQRERALAAAQGSTPAPPSEALPLSPASAGQSLGAAVQAASSAAADSVSEAASRSGSDSEAAASAPPVVPIAPAHAPRTRAASVSVLPPPDEPPTRKMMTVKASEKQTLLARLRDRGRVLQSDQVERILRDGHAQRGTGRAPSTTS
jgi:molecular chaperone DnaK